MFFPKKRFFVLLIMMLFLSGSIKIASGAATLKNSINIILITIDTLRSDHLGCYGYGAAKTPVIDGLAQDGILFTNAYTPIPLTLPSHTSIMTGEYPSQHGVQNNGTFMLADSAETLAEILKAQGYKTGAVVASFVLASHFGLNQGFDDYNDYFYQKAGKIPDYNLNSRDGKEVTDAAEKWLQQNHQKPLFLWVHYFDPHIPYTPPSPFDDLYKDRPYDGEIAYTDQCLGRLLEEIKKLSLFENTCIIVVGDHGEGLWEHNEQTHGVFIYNTTLLVPLIICYPELLPKGNKVASLVRTIDIMPTILELAGIKTQETAIQGTSLVSLLKGKEKEIKLDLYCESHYPEFNFNWAPLEGIVTGEGWKYIQAPKPELYNLIKDPQEKNNVLLSEPQQAKSLKERLVAFKKEDSLLSQSHEKARAITPSPEARERLKSLGYIGFSGSSSDEEKDTHDNQLLPDPKDRIALVGEIETARVLEGKGQTDQAIQKYEEVLSKDTDNKAALFSLGTTYMNTGEPQKAFSKIQKLAQIDPQNLDCQNVLGLLYDQLAKPDEAIRAFKKALQFNSKIAYIHNNLGKVYLKQKDTLDLAIQEFNQALSLSQDPHLTSEAVGNLGAVYAKQGLTEEAIKKFKESIALNSMNHDARFALADTYSHLGEIDQAIHEWEAIIALWPDDYIACYRLAVLNIDAHKSNQAIFYLKKCLQIRPDYIDARMLLQQINQGLMIN